ncbi:MAG: atpC [Pseudonocardiales bacterium]|nr:atpC [Pseudonocardiales bacterium]
MATMQVELVAVERPIWSGAATMVIARTSEGEIGILPGHSPLLAVLEAGWVVRIKPEAGGELRFAVHGGFLAVRDGSVSILAESAESDDEIDLASARQELEEAERQLQASGGGDSQWADARDRALARIRTADAGHASTSSV